MGLIRMFVSLLVLCFMAATAVAGEQAKAAAPAGFDVLNASTFWRWWSLDRKLMITEEFRKDGTNETAAITRLWDGQNLSRVNTVPPGEGWTGVDFDDTDWARMPWGDTLQQGIGPYARTGTLLLRGKFEVTDPALVKSLVVNIGNYCGGVVVYLNGREVVRQDMPAGKVDLETPAGSYPDEAYTGAADVMKSKRLRRLDKQELPLDALKKGANVLVIEVHRSDLHPKAVSARFGLLSVDGVTLRAEGGGIVPNTGRPKGFQVWNLDRNDRATVQEYGDPCTPVRPVRISGTRNGFFSGQLVVGNDAPIRNLKVDVSELKGAGTIPAACVQVRSILAHKPEYGYPVWFDRLSKVIPAEVLPEKNAGKASVQPLSFTVGIPADAAPGNYSGTITVSAEGLAPVAVPLEVKVASWVVPDPKNYGTFVGVYQSPTAVALTYKVPEWSEEHWKFLEKSMQLLGQVGNKALHIPVVEKTQYGNEEGMVIWVRNEDGSYDYDFTAFDRYVALSKKYLGPVDYVALYVWHAGGWEARKANQPNTVTVLDKKTGKKEHVQVPVFGTEESRKFWAPVLLAIKERLAKEGLDKGMCLGTLSDSTGPKEMFEMFNSIIPDMAWHRACHTVGSSQYYLWGPKDGKPALAKVILHEHCYGMDLPDPDRGMGVPALWKLRGRTGTAYYRLQNLDFNSLLVYRTMGSRALFMGKQGIGRICLDFWEVLGRKVDDYDTVFNRYPTSSCGQREPSVYRMAWAGTEGAEPTVRFEALREGLQEAEALIVISEASGNPERAGKELADKCKALLLERLRADIYLPDLRWSHYHMKTCHAAWRDLNARMFELAAEAAKAGIAGGRGK